jgi:hypothetical protein
MAVVVVGGQSRGVGKTSVVAGFIARLPEMHWTAFKITQHEHGLDRADGAPGDRQTDGRTFAISEERDASSGTDSGRFLAAGAVRSLLVRTQPGKLADAVPCIRTEIASAENAILESNSVMQFLQPDLYLTVLDAATTDFKDSAQLFLDRADAVLMRATALEPQWEGISMRLLRGKPRFTIVPPDYVTDEVVAFVRERTAPALRQTPIR